MESELQSAALRMSLVVIPAPAAADTEAPLTEWPEKITDIDASQLENFT